MSNTPFFDEITDSINDKNIEHALQLIDELNTDNFFNYDYLNLSLIKLNCYVFLLDIESFEKELNNFKSIYQSIFNEYLTEENSLIGFLDIMTNIISFLRSYPTFGKSGIIEDNTIDFTNEIIFFIELLKKYGNLDKRSKITYSDFIFKEKRNDIAKYIREIKEMVENPQFHQEITDIELKELMVDMVNKCICKCEKDNGYLHYL